MKDQTYRKLINIYLNDFNGLKNFEHEKINFSADEILAVPLVGEKTEFKELAKKLPVEILKNKWNNADYENLIIYKDSLADLINNLIDNKLPKKECFKIFEKANQQKHEDLLNFIKE